ncbi:hypothetical protein [Herbaspirillum sp. CF444]|uniref:hypothetical protein n=1 Tax=Herbaspirillum sp. CF444 TaxID=1144319 RepID=UPI0012F90819|nr:hypothetical protein [Herbaspirillum sp. CF444]
MGMFPECSKRASQKTKSAIVACPAHAHKAPDSRKRDREAQRNAEKQDGARKKAAPGVESINSGANLSFRTVRSVSVTQALPGHPANGNKTARTPSGWLHLHDEKREQPPSQ